MPFRQYHLRGKISGKPGQALLYSGLLFQNRIDGIDTFRVLVESEPAIYSYRIGTQL